MALVGYNNSQVFVANGYSASGNGQAGWHAANKVLVSVDAADYCTPTQTLLNKY